MGKVVQISHRSQVYYPEKIFSRIDSKVLCMHIKHNTLYVAMENGKISRFDLPQNSATNFQSNSQTTKVKVGNIERNWIFSSGANTISLFDSVHGKSFSLVFEPTEEPTHFEVVDFQINGFNNTNIYVILKSTSSVESNPDRFWLKQLVVDVSETKSPWKIKNEREVESCVLEIYSTENKIFLGKRAENQPMFYEIQIIDMRTFATIGSLPIHFDNYNHMSPIRFMLISSGANTKYFFKQSNENTRSIRWVETRLYTVDEDRRIICWKLNAKVMKF